MVFGEDHCKGVKAPYGLSITSSVITSLLTVITLPGNLLICIAMLRNPNKELRTTFNYLLLNVAVSDLIIGAITDPIFVSFHLRYMNFPRRMFTIPDPCVFVCDGHIILTSNQFRVGFCGGRKTGEKPSKKGPCWKIF
jgi:hypothetical protein